MDADQSADAIEVVGDSSGPSDPSASCAEDAIEIVADFSGREKDPWTVPAWFFFALLCFGWIGFLLGGLGGVMLVGALGLGIGILSARYSGWLDRRMGYTHATITADGITLRPSKRGFPKAQHFAWATVRHVKSVRFPGFGLLAIRLDAPSWLRRVFEGGVNLRRELWTRPEFVQAIRQYVPAERIRRGALDPPPDELSLRYRVIVAAVLLGGVLSMAGFLLHGVTPPDFSNPTTPTLPWVYWLLLPVPLCPFPLVLLGYPGGIRRAYVCFAPLVFIHVPFRLAFMGSFIHGNYPLSRGCYGMVAGLFIGLALVVLVARRTIRWRSVFFAYGLAGAGFVAGFVSHPGLPMTLVGSGTLPHVATAWTPNGDGFVLLGSGTDRPVCLDLLETPSTITWYDARLRRERTRSLPAERYRYGQLIVGQNFVLYRHRSPTEGDPDSITLLPRGEGEPRTVFEADGLGHVRHSPLRRYALFSSYAADDEEDDPGELHMIDLVTGETQPLVLPAGTGPVVETRIRDDGSLLWLSGVWPRNEDGDRIYSDDDLPADGKFAHPGKLFVLWLWDPAADVQPSRLYTAKTQWLICRTAEEFRQIFVSRLTAAAPLRRETIELDMTGDEITETPRSEPSFRPQSAESDDGRFVVRMEEGWALHQNKVSIEDRLSGRSASLRFGVWNSGWWRPFQPGGHKRLFERLAFRRDLWGWGFEKHQRVVSEVYMLDLDTAWGDEGE